MTENSITHIVVCGAGTMGSGIAQVAAQHGFATTLYELQPAVLQKAREAIGKNLDMLVTKGKMTAEEAAATLGRLQFTGEAADARGQLIIEAIVERLDAKLSLLQSMYAVNGRKAIYASNTSSLSITALQEALPFAEQICGMHFFNPATLMKLVEVVRGEHTLPEVVAAVEAICHRMGKKPVHCTDAPGFIVNHVARPYYLEGMRLVEAGLATPETVDAALQAAGFKMGPFALMDLIGIDINYAVSCQVWEALGKPERLTPSPLQAEKLAAGKLGRKSGEGFYAYPSR